MNKRYCIHTYKLFWKQTVFYCHYLCILFQFQQHLSSTRRHSSNWASSTSGHLTDYTAVHIKPAVADPEGVESAYSTKTWRINFIPSSRLATQAAADSISCPDNRTHYMLSQSGVPISPASKGSEVMPSWSEPKSLSLLSQYIVLKSCWRSLILNCLGG